MGVHKFHIDFSEFEGLLKELELAGGNVKEVTEEALIKSHRYITPKIEKKLDKSNLPHQGKYSTQARKQSLKQVIKEPTIDWEGKGTCSVAVGFSLDETIVPIFLIRGTSSMNGVKGLKALLEGKKTKDEIAEIQQEVILKAFDDLR